VKNTYAQQIKYFREDNMTTRSKFVLNGFVFSFFFSVVLFISAGRIDYIQGWIYFFTSLLTTSMNILAVQKDSELMNERLQPGEGAKSWDKLLLGFSALISLSTIVLAGLDSGRYQWSPPFHWIITVFGILLMIIGQIVFLTARKENKFFSTVVRIQKDRGHTVCQTGIYTVIRHPGYLGMIISTIGLPLLLGSLWSIVPAFLAVILLCRRTYLEDALLKDELIGYHEYSQNVCYKLVPGMW
jgi:protein-S-isoprenylcysteine O-methyltransferase Ste14